MLVCAALLLLPCCVTLHIVPLGLCRCCPAAVTCAAVLEHVCAMQIQFKGMTLYDCGVSYNPNHPESNPACTRVTNVQQSLRLQVSTLVLTYATSHHMLCMSCLVGYQHGNMQNIYGAMVLDCTMLCNPVKLLCTHHRLTLQSPSWLLVVKNACCVAACCVCGSDTGLCACCHYIARHCCLGVSCACVPAFSLQHARSSCIPWPSVLPIQYAKWFVGMQRDPNEWAWEPLALIAYLLFFRILVYIALRKRTKASVR